MSPPELVEGAGRADRQGDEAALHQLQAVVVRAAPLVAPADARQRFVERDEHGGKRSVARRNEQIAVGHLPSGEACTWT